MYRLQLPIKQPFFLSCVFLKSSPTKCSNLQQSSFYAQHARPRRMLAQRYLNAHLLDYSIRTHTHTTHERNQITILFLNRCHSVSLCAYFVVRSKLNWLRSRVQATIGVLFGGNRSVRRNISNRNWIYTYESLLSEEKREKLIVCTLDFVPMQLYQPIRSLLIAAREMKCVEWPLQLVVQKSRTPLQQPRYWSSA